MSFEKLSKTRKHFISFSEILEHTWGLPSVYDQINWSNDQFRTVVDSVQSFNNCRSAWLEQRQFFDLYLEAIGSHPLNFFIKSELDDAFKNLVRPDLDLYKLVSPITTFSLFQSSSNPVEVSFDQYTGSISHLSRNSSIYWTDEKSRLASFVYITYNESDFNQLSKTYGNPGYDKPNSTVNANPQSRAWNTILKNFYQSKTNEANFLAQIVLDNESVNLYGGFNEIWLSYTFTDGNNLHVEWLGLNKTATRLAEASMIKFMLPKQPKCSLIQFDTLVDVQQAAGKSSYYQRGAQGFQCQTSVSDKCSVTLNVQSLDAPIGRF